MGAGMGPGCRGGQNRQPAPGSEILLDHDSPGKNGTPAWRSP